MSQRQKVAIKHVLNGDSVSKAMTKAGYRPSVAKNPKRLTESKTFLKTLEKLGITDEKLAKVLDEGLEATRAVVMGTKSDESFVDVAPDFAVRHKYLETAIKLKGYVEKDKESGDINIVIPILGGKSVHRNNSDSQVIETEQEN